VMISPTGVQAIRPEGEVAVAKAAASRGTIMGLSSFASKSIEEVAAANENTFFQMYWTGTRDQLLQRMERARAAGAKALITTTDWSFSIGRDWGSPAIPERMNLAAVYKMAPEGMLRPRWTLEWLRSGLPDLTAPNLAPPSGPAPTFFQAYGEWSQTPPPSWEDLAWLREQWGGPFMVKGITRVDDARRAVDIGADSLSVSNHGGNNLDTTPASIRCLGPIADAVGGQIDVLMDGGIRRGGDVAKALALGARAVMIGRAYLWGLGANGQTGVENVLDLLRMGLDSALLGLGHTSTADLSRADLHIPDGFERTLGATGRTARKTPAERAASRTGTAGKSSTTSKTTATT
ncbi:pre-mycofactocin synthase MftD, partial [Microbacterium sp.]|uniref:pre-mycofactocin synthase MftD n=1 Tax=Microbacterium sp. TaxID=51671 RepID=UPI003A85D9D8